MYWNKDEDRYLMMNYQKQSADEMALALNRTRDSVRWRLCHLRLVNVRRWSKKEVQFLKDNYATMKNQDIADKLGRSRTSLVDKALKMGLEKDPVYLKAIYSRPNSGQFVKGCATWNKGLKFPNMAHRPHWFKKGQEPWNKLPDDLRDVVITLRKLKRKLNGKKLNR